MNQTTDASAVFAPIWRRKWLILAVGLLVAIGTYLYYRHEKPAYLATTKVYLGAGAEEQAPASLTGNAGGSGKKGSLEAGAQATLINSAIIKVPVRKTLRAMPKTKATRTALKGRAKAKASEKSQFITISAEARSAAGTALLANTTAQTYVKRQNQKYRRSVEAALGLARRQLHRIEATE
jgi:capsular polysaccharide biosynthesis protein